MELSTIRDRVKLKQLNDYEQLYMHALEKVIILHRPERKMRQTFYKK